MVIGEAELHRIGEYVKSNLKSWMEELGLLPADSSASASALLERVFRVEAQLRIGRELSQARFQASDKRFQDRLRENGLTT